MSGDYKPSYNSSPSRKRAILQNKDQASIYRYQMNGNIGNSGSNVLNDVTKYYNNQSNIRNRTTTTATTATTSQQQNHHIYNRNNSNSSNSNLYMDSDVEDDQDYTYSDNSRSIDYSQDFISGSNPRKLKESFSILQQAQQQTQQQHQQDQNINFQVPTTNATNATNATTQQHQQHQQIHNQQTQQQINKQNSHQSNQSHPQSQLHQQQNRNNINRQQSQNIFQRFIISPLQNIYYGKNSILRLWPVDTTESNRDEFCTKIKTFIWVFAISILFVFGILALVATKYHGINIYLPNTSTTTTLVENTITKEQLIPMLEDYFKQSKIFSNLEIKIKELSNNSNKESQEIIKELKNEINLIKLSNMDEETVNRLIIKMIDHYNDNENNKKELRQVFEKAIKDFNQFEKEKLERYEKKAMESLNIYESKASDSINKLSSKSNEQIKEFTNQFDLLVLKKFEELDSKSKQQLAQLGQESNSLINQQSEKLKKYQVELDSNGKEKVTQLLDEYKSLETQLKEFTSKLEKSMSSNIQTLFNDQKSSITKDINKQVSDQSIVINNQANHLTAQYNQITHQFTKIQQFIESNPSIESIHKTISSLEGIKELIDDILEVYSADKIAKVDYALLESGSSIEYYAKYYKVSKSYPTYRKEEQENETELQQEEPAKKQPFKFYFNELLNTAKDLTDLASGWLKPKEKVNEASTILEPTVNTGSCWAFYGQHGTAVIRLSQKVKVNEVTMEHINSRISHHIESAPKQFQVIGLMNSTDIGTDLGTFTYNTTINRHLQTFKVLETDNEYSHIVLKVISNYGYKYTCIYRFRVHGIHVEHPEAEQLINIDSQNQDQFIKNIEESIEIENKNNQDL